MQRKEEEQWQNDAAELGILPLETAKQEKSLQVELEPGITTPAADDEELVPSTPEMKANPTIVIPKDPKDGDLGLLILDDQAEVSNLTQPAVLAVTTPGASQEEDTETVTGATSMISVGSKQQKKV